MKKVQYDEMPARIEAVGNGSYRFRWAIEPLQVQYMLEIPAKTMYECFEVIVCGEPAPDKIKEAVIAALWPSSVEANLINNYNAARAGLLPESYADAYLQFLIERQAIKTEIESLFL